MIKKFDTFVNENYKVDESWRQVKAWLQIPKILLERLLALIIDFVPNIGTKYDQLAAKVDVGTGGQPNIIKEEPIKLTLNDVENEKLRKTLKMTGVFSEWNVYTFDRTYENRQPIYITKDELHKGDKYHGERLSEWKVDKNYVGKKQKRYLKSKGVSELSELEPQFWVVAALHTEKHDKMKSERDTRYENKKKKQLEKLVKDSIKEGDFGRTKSIAGEWNNDPIVFKVVRADRVDLMQQLIDACLELDGEEGVEDMLNMAIDNEGWTVNHKDYGSFNDIRTPLKQAKSEEMKTLIQNNLK